MLVIIISCASLLSSALAQEGSQPTAEAPQWQRALTGADAEQVSQWEATLDSLTPEKDREQATELAERILSLRTRVQGADHWQVRDAQLELSDLQRVLTADDRRNLDEASRLSQEAKRARDQNQLKKAVALAQRALDLHRAVHGDAHPETARSLHQLARLLKQQQEPAEAERLFQEALRVTRKALGDKHPDTAERQHDLAVLYHGLGRMPEAEQHYLQAAAVLRDARGVESDDVAMCMSNLGGLYWAMGRYGDAERILRSALDIQRQIHGDEHGDTAYTIKLLARIYQAQGRYTDAEPLYRESLRVNRKVHGSDHKDTAQAQEDLARMFWALGRYADAEPLYRDTLRIRRRILGSDHADTAISMNNLAKMYDLQGRRSEAEPLFQEAAKVWQSVHGDDHFYTAALKNNLATLYQAQGRYEEAERLFREALQIRRETLGDDHQDTAESLNNLAVLFEKQRRPSESEPLYREALQIWQKVHGPRHPAISAGLQNLATVVRAQGRFDEAQQLGVQAVEIARAGLGDHHPVTATCLRNLALHFQEQQNRVKADQAWTEAAVAYEMCRLSSAQGLQRAIAFGGRSPYPWQASNLLASGLAEQAYQALERDLARGLLDEQARRGESRLSPPEQRTRSRLLEQLGQLQPQILFLATRPEPTNDQSARLDRLSEQRRKVSAELSALAADVSRREVAPVADIQQALPEDAALLVWIDLGMEGSRLEEHWGCVVRNSGAPRWERLSGSDPDGTWTSDDIALSGRLRTALSRGATAAEIYSLASQLRRQRIAPLQPHLAGVSTMYVVPAYLMAGVPVELIVDGSTQVSYVPSGTFLTRSRRQDSVSNSGVLAVGDPVFTGRDEQSGKVWPDLPGTRVEVQTLRRLFDADVTELTDSEASEQRLDALRKSGHLDEYRYLHLATHGQGNDLVALGSSLVLAQDNLSGQLVAAPGEVLLDGRLTAREVLDHWDLNADLVTLSACETAIGQQGGGEGLVGFAQAFLSAGARSVCLSLWKVDDTATALLMDRFYANLAGQRPGLMQPMPKATALAEAKHWLRHLPADEFSRRTAVLTRGVARGDRGKGERLTLLLPDAEPRRSPSADVKPFAHPRYWSAFILVGDPN